MAKLKPQCLHGHTEATLSAQSSAMPQLHAATIWPQRNGSQSHRFRLCAARLVTMPLYTAASPTPKLHVVITRTPRVRQPAKHVSNA